MNIPFFPFPDDNIDPKKKAEKEWMLQACRASLYSYSQLPEGAIGLRSKYLYDKYKAYARAKQPVAPYQKLLNYGEDGVNNLLVTDWSIRSEIPTLRRTFIGIVQKVPFKPIINPVDDLARSEVDDKIYAAEAKLVLRNAMKRRGEQEMLQLPTMEINPDEPEDFDDLSVQQLGARHATAMEFEMVAQNVFAANKYDNIRAACAEDLFDYGVCVQKDDTVQGRTISIKRIDPRFLIINYCSQKDFSDWKFIGAVIPTQVSQLVAMSSGQITKEDVQKVYEMGQANIASFDIGLSGLNFGDRFETFYEQSKVFVLDVEIRSSDKVVLEGRQLKNGEPHYATINPEDVGKTKKNTYKTKYRENVYCAKWVIGTDIIFDYGPKKNNKRDRKNTSKALSSFHIGAVDIDNMCARSRIEGLIPIQDEMQIARYRMQNTINTVIPNPYAIDLDALESVSLTSGGELLTVEELLRLLYDKGALLYRSSLIDGDKTDPPITKLPGGVGSELLEYWNLINYGKTDMREQLGLNAMTDASTPNPKTLTEIARAAINGTGNAMSDIYMVQRNDAKELTESIVIRTQDIVHYGNTEYFLSSLGASTVERLKMIKDVDKYIYSVSMEDIPDPDALATLNAQILVAQEAGDLTIADILRLSNISNLKQKEEFVVNRVKKNQARKQQEALALQEANGKIQQESAIVSEQAKQKTLTLEYELKGKYITLEKNLDWRNTDASKQYDLEIERIASTGRIDAAAVQAEAKDITNKRTEAVKVATAEKKIDPKVLDVTLDFQSTVTPQTANKKPLEIRQEFSFLPSDEELMEEENQMQEQEMAEMEMGNEQGMDMQQTAGV